MAFQRAVKGQAKLRLALIGPSGSGKTYSALRIASGLGKRIALIDTENASSSHYAHRFTFDVCTLESFHPKRYIEAIHEAEAAGYDVLIIDSLSHAWAGKDGALQLVDDIAKRSQSGNSFGAWRDVTPLHNQMVDALVGCKCHLIVTMRSKMEYVQEKDDRGKTTIRKVGLQPIQRDGLDFEFDVVGDITIEHRLIISKTRCEALTDQAFDRPGEDVAKILHAWLTNSEQPEPAPRFEQPQPVAQPAPQPPAAQPKTANGNGQAQATNGNGQAAPRRAPTTEDLKAGWQRMWDKADALGIPVDKRPTLPMNANDGVIIARGRDLKALIAQYEAAIPGGANGSK
jgi:hypothetical protein